MDNNTEPFLPGLSFDGRKSLRSVADALEKLRELGGLHGTGNIECNILPIQLPKGQVIGLVCVIGARQDDGRRWVIRLPSATKFSAMSTTKVRQTFDIGLLNGAISDQEGNVTLHSGQHVHGVNLIPVPVHYDFDSTQHAIVWHALKLLGKLDECWRSGESPGRCCSGLHALAHRSNDADTSSHALPTGALGIALVIMVDVLSVSDSSRALDIPARSSPDWRPHYSVCHPATGLRSRRLVERRARTDRFSE